VASPDSSIGDIAAAVEKDPRMAAEILRMANSAAYIRLGRATNAKAAVARLGLRHVHNLAQTIFLQGLCDVREGPYKTLLSMVWRRSVARALSMRALCDLLDPLHALNGNTAYMIGLMSDIGASLLLWVASERLPGNLTVDDVRDTGALLDVVRKSHEQLAAAMLVRWNFEKVIVLSCSQHHAATPPVTNPLWWSLSVLGDHLASMLIPGDDPTSTNPRSRSMVERCAAEFCLPSTVLGRLLDQLKDEFAAVEGGKI
ncbi:MAG TPA: HDOD domain-containing protein, partial [Polyangia bacterium]|nr:HDOD domain-containing protein [Polyangia bacterium]